MPDHIGYDVWPLDDAAHPYPISDIDLQHSSESLIQGEVDIRLPGRAPAAKSFAESSVGINRIGQLTFAIRTERLPNGKLGLTGIMSVWHAHFWPDHGEDGPGTRHVFSIPDAKLRRGGLEEVLLAHGPHCDVAEAYWHVRRGGIRMRLDVHHLEMSPQQLRETRERNSRRSRRRPGLFNPTLPIYPLPPLTDPEEEEETPSGGSETPTPSPTPKPGSGENPTSGILSGIGAALAGVFERIAGWLRRI